MSENLWSKKDIPHSGWRAYSVDDMGDDRFTCDMCNKKEVRWAHFMTHPKYPTDIKVGCVCAEKLEVTYNGRAAETNAKKKSTWIKHVWKVGMVKDLPYYWKTLRGDTVKIFFYENFWHFFVLQRNKDEYHGLVLPGYNTPELAMAAVWDMYEVEGWL